MARYKPKYSILGVKDPEYKEFKKARLIENNKERLIEVRRIIEKYKNRTNINIGKNTVHLDSLMSFMNNKEEHEVKKLNTLKERGLFYGTVYKAEKRRLELEIYIDDIIQESENIEEKIKKCEFLIDKQFEHHNYIFDNELENLAFEEEASDFIIDKLQEQINRVLGKEQEFENLKIKPLQWVHNTNVLTTIFGVLYEKGLIKGQKSDLVKVIHNAFPEEKLSSLSDGIALKEKQSGINKYYNTEVRQKMEELVGKLPSPKKKKNVKS